MNKKNLKTNINKKTKLVALMGILASQAIALAFLENLIPPIPGLPPGAKLGLANVVTMFTASTIGLGGAIYITILKAIFVGATRGVTAFLMSLAGGLLSTLTMWMMLNIKNKPFGILGVAVSSAVAHNIGQLIVAIILTGTAMFATYAPFLLFFAIVAGIITGSILKVTLPLLEKQHKYFKK